MLSLPPGIFPPFLTPFPAGWLGGATGGSTLPTVADGGCGQPTLSSRLRRGGSGPPPRRGCCSLRSHPCPPPPPTQPHCIPPRCTAWLPPADATRPWALSALSTRALVAVACATARRVGEGDPPPQGPEQRLRPPPSASLRYAFSAPPLPSPPADSSACRRGHAERAVLPPGPHAQSAAPPPSVGAPRGRGVGGCPGA